MKKILLIGQNSFIGKTLKHHFLHNSRGFLVNTTSARTEEWRKISFEIYDCIIYLAGIRADQTDEETTALSYHLNCSLPCEIAEAAKAAGVPRFVFLSTIDVYGKTAAFGRQIIIDKKTAAEPITLFGESKLAGELALKELENDNFKLITLRLPLVYGMGCPGIYEEMKQLVLTGKKLPRVKNEFSAINVATLCAFIHYLIENDYTGTFHPQNKSYITSYELFEMIARELVTPLNLSKWLAFKYKLFKSACPAEESKFYGSLTYSKEIDL